MTLKYPGIPHYSKFPMEVLPLQIHNEKPLINRHYLRPPTRLVHRTRGQWRRPKPVCAPQTLEAAALQHTPDISATHTVYSWRVTEAPLGIQE